MKKMNMRKKIVAALMAANGISAISGGDLNAMEFVSKPLRTMKQYHIEGKKQGKTRLAECVQIHDPIPWTRHPDHLITQKQLQKFLDDNKRDILYAMFQGQDHRIEAYLKANNTKDVKEALDNWQYTGRGLLHGNKSVENDQKYYMSDDNYKRDID